MIYYDLKLGLSFVRGGFTLQRSESARVEPPKLSDRSREPCARTGQHGGLYAEAGLSSVVSDMVMILPMIIIAITTMMTITIIIIIIITIVRTSGGQSRPRSGHAARDGTKGPKPLVASSDPLGRRRVRHERSSCCYNGEPN